MRFVHVTESGPAPAQQGHHSHGHAEQDHLGGLGNHLCVCYIVIFVDITEPGPAPAKQGHHSHDHAEQEHSGGLGNHHVCVIFLDLTDK